VWEKEKQLFYKNNKRNLTNHFHVKSDSFNMFYQIAGSQWSGCPEVGFTRFKGKFRELFFTSGELFFDDSYFV